MNSSDLRRAFLQYFEKKGHPILPSSPVVPHKDPTLLFINAGMNQFKDIFLGKDKRDYNSATTSQKCIRVGGKHNDLENVGHTKRHLTFFEMLGNFSFGAYGKKEAIDFSWKLMTEILQFEPERIWPTVFKEDNEAFEYWLKHIPEERIVRFGEKTNFWAMGDTGPCGPCSELLYDRGAAYGDATHPEQDLTEERFLEVWNLVFMEQNSLPDGTRNPLPTPCIDTGMGLERAISLKLDVDNVFETDILRSLIAQVEQISGKKYDPMEKELSAAFRVISDHLRCLAFAISDGAQPSNLDRGYVLRKVLRRAVRYGKRLGLEKPFLAEVLPRLVETMGEDYPELKKNEGRIAEIITGEEESFTRTLKRGGALLSKVIASAHDHGNEISGDDAFKLKDTYGLPFEEIELLAKDEGLAVGTTRYHELEAAAKERSKKAHKQTKQVAEENQFANYLETHAPCHFSGYEQTQEHAKVTSLLKEGEFVEELQSGDEGLVILDQTPFYAEKGGQVGDTGSLKTDTGLIAMVKDTQNPYEGVITHSVQVKEGSIRNGDALVVAIDEERRQKIANNHTATHLLHWALQKVLGEHVKQGGSVVEPGRLRFDFTHHKALTKEELQQIERLINEKIRLNSPVSDYELDYSEVQKREDIKQFFGEKYLSRVRVIDIDLKDAHSKELCGGIHTKNVGTIGLFRIAKEGSIAAGVRRIDAVTGKEAEELLYENDALIEQLRSITKSKAGKELDRIKELLKLNKEMEKSLEKAELKEIASLSKSLLSNKQSDLELPFIVQEVSLGAKALRTLSSSLMDQLNEGVICLASTQNGKCALLIQASKKAVEKGVHAGKLIQSLAPIVGGKGGGKADLAQAGGTDTKKIDQLIKEAKTQISCSLSS